LQALLTLDISSNALNGLLPQLPANLATVDASRNELGGALPAPLPASLLSFRADHNRLSGGVPALLLTQKTALQRLSLRNNSLTGILMKELLLNGGLAGRGGESWGRGEGREGEGECGLAQS
jgi:hypothetical protein